MDTLLLQAVLKIFAAKDRPRSHPLIVHLDSTDKLTQWAEHIPPAAQALADAFWPGPLTLLLHKAPWVDATVTGGLDTIALRVPDHPVLRCIIAELDSGIAAPSANPHKRLSPTSAAQVLAGLSGRITAVLDGGPCSIGLESTLVDLTGDSVRILPRDKEGYARELYQRLHELDSLHPQRNLAETPPQEEAWLDVHNRLSRAATPLPS